MTTYTGINAARNCDLDLTIGQALHLGEWIDIRIEEAVAAKQEAILSVNANLLTVLDLLCKAADNGEWHYSRDCDVEGRHDTCLLCAAIREGQIAIAKAKGT